MATSKTGITRGFILLIFLGTFVALLVVLDKKPSSWPALLLSEQATTSTPSPSPIPAPLMKPKDIPARKILQNDYHVFQTFNNCAPAALSMALSYYGVRVSQEELAAQLRPNNNRKGINDDKSTPPNELAEKAQEYNLIPYFRANGTIALMKELIANDLPILTRTLLYSDKNFAHYRVIKGYDETTGELIQDDSLQGKNLRYSYDAFLKLWKPFNYAYLVLVPPEKQKIVEAILGQEVVSGVAWQNAAARAEKELNENPNDVTARFDLSVARFYTGDYEQAAKEFAEIEEAVPDLVLWYQMEPIQANFEIGNDTRVLSLATRILSKNISYAELYVLRGYIYAKENKPKLAKQEFENAIFYNKNLKSAREALASLAAE